MRTAYGLNTIQLYSIILVHDSSEGVNLAVSTDNGSSAGTSEDIADTHEDITDTSVGSDNEHTTYCYCNGTDDGSDML